MTAYGFFLLSFHTTCWSGTLEALLLSLFPCSVSSTKGFANLSLHTFELSVSAFEKRRVICEGHVNPLFHQGSWQMFLSQVGDFWGQHETSLYPGQIHAGIVLAHRVSPRSCTDLQQFGCIICRFFFSFFDLTYIEPIVCFCLAVTESARWNISPALNSFICGCCGLLVIFLSQNVFCFLSFSFCHASLPPSLHPSPSSGRWPWPRWVTSKPPHLANISVTVRTLTGTNWLCDDSRCLTVRYAITFQLFLKTGEHLFIGATNPYEGRNSGSFIWLP